jgi:hypothetical protein
MSNNSRNILTALIHFTSRVPPSEKQAKPIRGSAQSIIPPEHFIILIIIITAWL